MENILYLVALAAAVWVIYDVLAKQKGMSTLFKVLWIVGAVFFSVLTAIVYFFVLKKGKF